MDFVTLDAITRAAERIRGGARRTPLLDVSFEAGRPLLLKCETLQPGGAFKARGATNMLARLSPADRARGVITYSSGNHGLAVALAAARLGVTATVVMPVDAPAIKIAGVERWGGEVILHGRTTLERRALAEAEAAARGLTMIPPFDHEWIIEAQATCGIEILDERPDVDVIVVPIGGGGLLAGVAAAAKQRRPDVAVVGVEPRGAARMTASLSAGHPVTLDRISTIADGLQSVRPGDLTFAYVRRWVDAIIVVDDARFVDAVSWLFSEAKLVVEPSGAAAVAATLWPDEGSVLADRTKTVAAILSGGNVGLETLVELAAGRTAGPAAPGR
jgi:threonine dehydratase